jgi:hypothetical protein
MTSHFGSHMELEIKYELSDWKTFQEFVEKRICKESKAWWDSMWVNLLLWFLLALTFFIFFQSGTGFNWPTAAIVAFALLYFFASIALNGIKAKRACQPSEGGAFLRHHKFIVNDEGITTIGADYEAKHKWSIVQRIENTEEAIYIFIDTIHAFIFPLSKVANPKELLAVINKNVTSNSTVTPQAAQAS